MHRQTRSFRFNSWKLISKKGRQISIGRLATVAGSLTSSTLGNSPTLPKAILRLVLGVARTGIVGSTCTSLDLSEFFTFVRSVLSRITVTELYERRYSPCCWAWSAVATPTPAQQNDRPRGPKISGVSAARCWHRESLYKRFNALTVQTRR